MNLTQLLAANLGLSLAIMFGLWLVSLFKKDASIVDPYWGFGFVVLAWFSIVSTGNWKLVPVLLLVLVTIWGVRLSTYLWFRNRGKGEDRRYGAMRKKHGNRFWWVSLFTVFLLQGTIMWFVAMPVISGIALESSFHLPTPVFEICIAIGLVVWTVGFIFESAGDYQMARFKSDPENKGAVMDRGLWRYTRHPNYFGDFCIWWGHFGVATAAGAWWTLLSPTAMSFFLLKVSGVTMLESDIEERRPAYRIYKQNTNTFFPGPPKSKTQNSK